MFHCFRQYNPHCKRKFHSFNIHGFNFLYIEFSISLYKINIVFARVNRKQYLQWHLEIVYSVKYKHYWSLLKRNAEYRKNKILNLWGLSYCTFSVKKMSFRMEGFLKKIQKAFKKHYPISLDYIYNNKLFQFWNSNEHGHR